MTLSNTNVLRQWINDRKKNPFAISPSIGITAQYYNDINKIVLKLARMVRKEVYPILKKYEIEYARPNAQEKKHVKPLFNDSAFGLELTSAFASIQREFLWLNRYANRIAINRITQQDSYNRREFIKAFQRATGVDVSSALGSTVRIYGKNINQDTVANIGRAVAENVRLIQTVPQQHLAKIEQRILQGISNGDDAFNLMSFVEEVNEQNSRRARTIARDQMQKLTSVLAQARQREIGIEGYIWRSSDDERTRPDHKENDGKTFQWAKPPTKTGHPGEDINCRCTAEPDLSQFMPQLAPANLAQGPLAKNRIPI